VNGILFFFKRFNAQPTKQKAGNFVPLHSMGFKIYTKAGDDGKTGLIGGERVSKHHIRVESYGTVDELNSHIGMIRCHVKGEQEEVLLAEVQNDLFTCSHWPDSLITKTEALKSFGKLKNNFLSIFFTTSINFNKPTLHLL